MDFQRRDIWNVVEIYLDRFVREFLRAHSPQEKADLERKWLDPRRGVIHRLVNKPILAEARPSAQLIFVELLGNGVLNAARACR
jgi:hypothetical protein